MRNPNEKTPLLTISQDIGTAPGDIVLAMVPVKEEGIIENDNNNPDEKDFCRLEFIAINFRPLFKLILEFYLSENSQLDSDIKTQLLKIANLRIGSKKINSAIRQIILESDDFLPRIKAKINEKRRRELGQINARFDYLSIGLVGSLAIIEPSLMLSQFQQAFVSNWPRFVNASKWGYALKSEYLYPSSMLPFQNNLEIYPSMGDCLTRGNTSTWAYWVGRPSADPGPVSSILDLGVNGPFSNGSCGFWFANFAMMLLSGLMAFLTFRSFSFSPSPLISAFFLMVCAGFNTMLVLIPKFFTNDWANTYLLDKLCAQVPKMALTNIPVYMPNLPPLPWEGYSASPLSSNFTGTLLNPNGVLTQLVARYAPGSSVLGNAGTKVSITIATVGFFGALALAGARKRSENAVEARAKGLAFD